MSEAPMTTEEMQRIADGIKQYLDMPKEVKAQITQWKFSDAVDELTRSVIDFHKRHATATRSNAVENQAKAFAQESGEFVWAVAEGDKVKAAKEAADVLFTLIGVATLAGITREQLADAMRAIAASNDNKTVEKGWNWNARGTKVEKLTTTEPDAGGA